jgi:SRSO17 transposase
MALCKLLSHDIVASYYKLLDFYKEFRTYFETDSAKRWGLKYLQSQLLCNKRLSIAEASRTVIGGNHQDMHHFISNSPWQDEPIIDHIQKMVNESIGDSDDGALILDETGFTKKGTKSVGVSRQYNGNLGKIDNCQVGVFLSYARENMAILIDKRLYLPESWASDIERRKECGIPDEITFQTKAQLGLDMIFEADDRNIKYGWVGFDAHYGEQPWFLDALAKKQIIYMAEVPCDTRVWLDKPPSTEIPVRNGSRGPHPKKEKIVEGEPDATEVRQIEKNIAKDKWMRIKVRDGEKGPMIWDFTFLRAYAVRDGLPNDREEWLIIRKEVFDQSELKFCLSNAPAELPPTKLASMVARRFWVEKALKDAKGEAKLDEYQLRSWQGWHHHITMTLIAMLFLLMLTIDMKGKASLLTIQDVRFILENVLPKKRFDSEEVIALLEEKHRQRLAARNSHTKKKIERLKML